MKAFALLAAALLVLVGSTAAVTRSPAVDFGGGMGTAFDSEPTYGGEGPGNPTAPGGDASALVPDVHVGLKVTAKRGFIEIVFRTWTDDASAGVATITATSADALGNVRLVTSGSAGDRLARIAYKPFGLPVVVSGSEPTYGYTGEYREPTPNLIYLHSRWYDPTIGRFLSADDRLGRLSMPQDQNRYAYVVNNPMAYTDPTGHVLNGIAAGIGGLLGFIIGGAGCLIFGGDDCWKAALAGAAAGFLAGLTFGASLALAGTAGLGTAATTATGATVFTFTGWSGAAAMVFAGATAGAIGGVANYLLGSALYGQEITAQGLVNAMGTGIIVGGITAGAGYGVGRGLGLTMCIRVAPAKGLTVDDVINDPNLLRKSGGNLRTPADVPELIADARAKGWTVTQQAQGSQAGRGLRMYGPIDGQTIRYHPGPGSHHGTYWYVASGRTGPAWVGAQVTYWGNPPPPGVRL